MFLLRPEATEPLVGVAGSRLREVRGLGQQAPSGERGVERKRVGVGKRGARMWERFMSELREEHIGLSDGGGSDPGEVSVSATLRAAYEEVVAAGTNE